MEREPVLQISYSLSNIGNAVHQLWQYAHQHRVWTLKGDMGAGKTTLVHALCDMLGVKDAVSSPTFALINHYTFEQEGRQQTIYHMDWYRLKDEEEAYNAGVEDSILQPDSYAIIEWPEKAAGLLPKNYLQIEIESTGAEERELRVYSV